MKKKIVNTDDNDKLNPMADVRNYGAGAEDGVLEDHEQDGPGDEQDELKEDQPLPDEIAFP